MEVKNFYSRPEGNLPEEINEVLESGLYFKMERIISDGHRTPKDKVYDSPYYEWVIVLKGSGKLKFIYEDGEEKIEMNEGDYILIPPHTQHRVIDTSNNTFWLAIYFDKDEEEEE